MNWQNLKKRASALALAAVLSVSLTVPGAAAEVIRDGVTPTYDEAYYATLDYYGNLLEGSVVKSYAMNGKDSLTDYGVYDEVINLTDNAAPVSEDNSTSFHFSNGAPDRFYFEGKTKQPFENLPWTLTLRYTLNGVPAKAEDLAGKQGVVEILLDAVPNGEASDYARYNYTLAVTALFNQDDILSLEAEGAQVQLVGNLRTVLFLCLPGEEQHFTIRVGSNDFSFGGLTVLMAPATLAQLEEIAKLSQRKDDLEEDYRALSGSLDDLLDSLNDIQNGLYASAKGLDQLEAARSTFSGGKGALYSGTDRLREDLSNLADLLSPMEQRVQLLSQTVTDSKAVLNEMTDATVTLQAQLADMEMALYGLEQGTYDLKHVLDVAGDLEGSLLRLEHALGGSHVNTHSVATNSTALVNKVKNVRGAYDAKDETTFMLKMLEAQGMGQAQAQATVKNISDLSAAVNGGLIKPEQLTAEQKSALESAKQMQDLHAAVQGNQLGFQDFCEKLPNVSANQAKQMNDLWLIYNAGGPVTSARNRSRSEILSETPPVQAQEPPEAETPEPDQAPEAGQVSETTQAPEQLQPSEEPVPEASTGTPEETPPPESAPAPAGDVPETSGNESPEPLKKGQMSARLVLNAALDAEDDSSGSSDGSMDPPEDNSGGADGGSGSTEPPGDDSGKPEPPDGGGAEPPGDDSGKPEPPDGGGSTPSDPNKPPQSGTVGGAVVDLITNGLDSASARIDQIQYELTAIFNDLKYPTSAVVGGLADLCGELSILTRDLDDAGNIMGSLGESSGTLREILEDVDALRTLLNSYEPTLQEALANAGVLSASAVTTIRDTETLLADAENLARSTGKNLDAGTKQSLRGLSAALRQTAKALATTKQVKEAKNTVTQIIEDTWNEYTGDVNNILLMDATAKPVSLTDERNPSPSSIQILIRTQEIKEAEAETLDESAAAKEQSSFWGRVAQMFQDFWNAITGIFH